MNSDFISNMAWEYTIHFEYVFPFFYDSNYCIEIYERI